MQLKRMLKLGSYQTAWHMAHRIRLAMNEEPMRGMLSGTVEADETYVGGRRKGVRPGRPGRDSHKTPVFALVERDGRVRARVVPNVTREDPKDCDSRVGPFLVPHRDGRVRRLQPDR